MGPAIGVVASALFVWTLASHSVVQASSTRYVPANIDALFRGMNFTGHVRARTSLEDVIAAQDYGSLDPRYGVPMPSDAKFPVASNSKVFTAISLYQLQERGLLNVSSDIADLLSPADLVALGFPAGTTRYCPTVTSSSEAIRSLLDTHFRSTQQKTTAPSTTFHLPTSVSDQIARILQNDKAEEEAARRSGNTTRCARITIVDLLSMSSGIFDPITPMFLPYPGSIALALGQYLQRPLLFTPGTQYYYSNPAFMFAAYFVEKISGLSFKAYLQKHLFDPLELTNTYYDPYNAGLGIDRKRVVEHYQYINSQDVSQELALGHCQEIQLGSINGAGGLVSTTDDEAKVYFTLFNYSNGGRPVLQHTASLREIVKPRTPIGGGVAFAQGLFVRGQPPSTAQYFPPTIMYEGELMCTHTANVLDTTTTPFRMVQAWRSTTVVYLTPEELTEAQSAPAGAGTLVQVLSQFEHQPKLLNAAFEVLNIAPW